MFQQVAAEAVSILTVFAFRSGLSFHVLDLHNSIFTFYIRTKSESRVGIDDYLLLKVEIKSFRIWIQNCKKIMTSVQSLIAIHIWTFCEFDLHYCFFDVAFQTIFAKDMSTVIIEWKLASIDPSSQANLTNEKAFPLKTYLLRIFLEFLMNQVNFLYLSLLFV